MNTIESLKSIPSTRIVPNVNCPKATTGTQLNWNTEQCILRIEVDNPCVYGCPVAEKLCKKHDWPVRAKGEYKRKIRLTSEGVTARKPASRPRMRRGSYGKYSGDAWKGLLAHERKWGHESVWERNTTLLKDALDGVPMVTVSRNARMTKARANQIIKALCFTLNPKLYARLFDFVDGATRFKIKLARANKEKFLGRMPVEYPEYEGEEDA